MFIKYTGYSDTMNFYIRDLKQFYGMKRNIWTDVPEKIANILLKDNHFISKDDFCFKLEQIDHPIRLALFRFGAMGDLIQLIPIVKFIKKEYRHKIILITQDCFVEFFSKIPEVFDEVYSNSSFRKDMFDKMIYLDGVPEMDHSLQNKEAKMHRVKIFEEFLCLKLDKYDFSFNIDQKIYTQVEELLNAHIQQHQTSTGC